MRLGRYLLSVGLGFRVYVLGRVGLRVGVWGTDLTWEFCRFDKDHLRKGSGFRYSGFKDAGLASELYMVFVRLLQSLGV